MNKRVVIAIGWHVMLSNQSQKEMVIGILTLKYVKPRPSMKRGLKVLADQNVKMM